MNTSATHAVKRNPVAAGFRGEFRLGDLTATRYNGRKTARTQQDIQAMARSIYAHGGVMQNLLLVPEMIEGKWTGKYGTAGGETRRLGTCLLRDGFIPEAAGVYTDDFLLPGLVVAEPEASAISATENIRRTQLHPADEFEAFRELFDQCGSAEHVADFFAVSVATVERRLKLANASPRLFELFRQGGMSIEQLMALCLVDDHRRQEAAWKAGERNTYLRNAQNLRAALTVGKINLRDSRVAQFVGAACYEAAGGVVVRDLFSKHADDGYIEDGALLQRLAADKLEAVAARVRGEAPWAWVEVKLDFSHSVSSKYERCAIRKRPATQAEAKQLRALQAQLDAACAKLQRSAEDDSVSQEAHDLLDEEAAALRHQFTELDDSRITVEAALQALAGVVVTIGHHGHVECTRGLVRVEDRKALNRAVKAKEAGKASKAGDVVAASTSSQADELPRPLRLRLGAQRTAAMQLVVARNPPVALATLAYSLVQTVLLDEHHASALRISTRSGRDRLSTLDPAIEQSSAYVEMGLLAATWKARLPASGLLAWLIDQPQADLLQLLAICTALTLDSIGEHLFDAAPLSGHGAEIATATKLDMADFWTPTAATFFGGVSKAQAVAVIRSAVSPEAAVPLDGLKKGEACAKAEALMAGSRWLPALLKV